MRETYPCNNFFDEECFHVAGVCAGSLNDEKTVMTISDQSEGYTFQEMKKSQVKELINSLESIYKQMKEDNE